MKPELAIYGFILLDHFCGSWTVTYYGDRLASFGATASLIGLMVATRALCTTLAAPFLGRLTDKWGRLPIARLVATGTLLTCLLEYFASNLWMYGLSRFTFGLTRVCMTVANAMVCNLYADPKDRTAAMGKNYSAAGMGFLLGSALGGAVASSADAYRLASGLNLAVAFVSFAWTFFLLRETQSPAKSNEQANNSASTSKTSLFDALRTIYTNEDLRALFFFHTLVLICNIGPQHASFEFIRLQLNLSTSMRGLFLVAVGIASVASQASFSSLVSKIGTARFVDLCVLGSAIATILAPTGGFMLFSVVTLLGTFCGVVSSTLLSTLSNASPPELSGTVNGLHESLSNLALVVGGLYCPLTTDIHLYAPFWTAGAVLLIGLATLRPKLLFQAEAKQKTE